MDSIIHFIAYSVAGTNNHDAAIRILNRNEPGYDWKEIQNVVNEVIHHDAFTIDELKRILT